MLEYKVQVSLLAADAIRMPHTRTVAYYQEDEDVNIFPYLTVCNCGQEEAHGTM